MNDTPWRWRRVVQAVCTFVAFFFLPNASPGTKKGTLKEKASPIKARVGMRRNALEGESV